MVSPPRHWPEFRLLGADLSDGVDVRALTKLMTDLSIALRVIADEHLGLGERRGPMTVEERVLAGGRHRAEGRVRRGGRDDLELPFDRADDAGRDDLSTVLADVLGTDEGAAGAAQRRPGAGGAGVGRARDNVRTTLWEWK